MRRVAIALASSFFGYVFSPDLQSFVFVNSKSYRATDEHGRGANQSA